MALIVFVFLAWGLAPRAFALVVINEFLAAPSSEGLTGDANGDGVFSSGGDEFIELYNTGDTAVDMGGWSISDKIKVRHSFGDAMTMAPGEYYVVFGGGEIGIDDILGDTASGGSLGLNNSGDEITLLNHLGTIIDEVSYGKEADSGQSLARYPDGEGAFRLHTEISAAQGARFSPGRGFFQSQQEDPADTSQATVPEPVTILTLGTGLISFLLRRNLG